LTALSAFYVAKVLLSHGGIERYQAIAEAKQFAQDNPDSLTAKLYGKKKKRPKRRKKED
jgi:hypothetical protein